MQVTCKASTHCSWLNFNLGNIFRTSPEDADHPLGVIFESAKHVFQPFYRGCFTRSLFTMLKEKSKRYFQRKFYMKSIGGDFAKPKDFRPSPKAENPKGPGV